MTQTQMILNHLKSFGSITPRDALELYGCMRLGARIYDLRKAGHSISKSNETKPNRFGEMTTYARYMLEVNE